MIVVKVRDRDIKAAPMGPVTTGSEGLPVRWYFDEAWDDLTKIAVFRVGETYGPDMAILEDVCIVPNQLLVQDNAGENLFIGVYGRDLNGEIAVPTIWTYIRIEDGAVPQTVDPAEPTPEWTQQVQNAADEALRVAHGVRQDADDGKFDGYSPVVTLSEIPHGHRVNITDKEHQEEGQSFDVMDGASAYEQAVAGGYEGTEAEFAEDLAGFSEKAQTAADAAAAAAQSAESAADSASTATTKAGEAADSAGLAESAKSTAQEAAQSALNESWNATQQASYAGAARQAAEMAQHLSQEAKGKAEDAQSAAEDARDAAAASATAAAGSATAAADSAAAAASSATAAGNAQTAAEDAQEAAETAQAAAESARDTAISALQTESATQQAAIQQKGEETLASIPEDYTDLTEDVSDLKSAKAPVIINTASGTIASFEDGADGMPIKKLVVNIEPVQEGSGDPSPTNIRPISGLMGCNVMRTGKNLFNESLADWEDNVVINSSGAEVSNMGYKTTNFYSPIASGTYTFQYNKGDTIAAAALITYYDKNKIFISRANAVDAVNGSGIKTGLITVPDNACFYRLSLLRNYSTNVQLEFGSTATAYEPYQGDTYNIAFPSPDPGTVYGGTLDVVNGKLTVTSSRRHASELTWTKNGNLEHGFNGAGFTERLRNINAFGRTDVFCDTYKWYNANPPDGLMPTTPNGIALSKSVSNTTIYIVDDRFSTVDDFVSSFATHDPLIVVPRQTPITYDLTADEVTTLLGTNNIWADCGSVEVTYCADTKLYIQKINAPTDDDMIADARIESGKYFLIGNTLYLSTTLILAGDTIIPGTNCTKTNLAEALNALNT